MLNKLLSMIRQYDMIAPGDSVICAVSGGADSMALLFALYLLREKLDIQVKAAHFNHNLRGEESDGDAQFVRDFCAQYDIELYVGSANVWAGKKGLEAAARDARYAFLGSLTGKIATAHTANDNAETVLMHMTRGTGLRGLGGITPVMGRFIRPMLSVTRKQVMDFLGEYHISHREDSSNATNDFLRNRLRHNVLPQLERENPHIAENLSAMALRLRQDEQLLSDLAQTGYSMDVKDLKAMHSAQRSRVLEMILKQNGVPEPEAEHISLAEALVFSEKPSAKAAFPGGVTLRRCYDQLVAQNEPEPLETTVLECPSELELPEVRIICRPADAIINTASVFTVRPEGTVLLRCRNAGDEMRCAGGTKSLKKLYIDHKIPAAQRCRVPVLSDDRGVLAVCGIGADQNRIPTELPAWQICFEEKNLD